jgi:hypothetical protein
MRYGSKSTQSTHDMVVVVMVVMVVVVVVVVVVVPGLSGRNCEEAWQRLHPSRQGHSSFTAMRRRTQNYGTMSVVVNFQNDHYGSDMKM